MKYLFVGGRRVRSSNRISQGNITMRSNGKVRRIELFFTADGFNVTENISKSWAKYYKLTGTRISL